ELLQKERQPAGPTAEGEAAGDLYEGHSESAVPEYIPFEFTPEPIPEKIDIDPIEAERTSSLPLESSAKPITGNTPYASLFVYVSVVSEVGVRRVAGHAGLVVYKHGKHTPEVADLTLKRNFVRNLVVNEDGRWLNTVNQDPHKVIDDIHTVPKKVYEIPIDENQYNNLQSQKNKIIAEADNSLFGEKSEAGENNCVTLVADLLRGAGIKVPSEIGRKKVNIPPNPLGRKTSVVPPFKDWLDGQVAEGKANHRNAGQISDWLKRTLDYYPKKRSVQERSAASQQRLAELKRKRASIETQMQDKLYDIGKDRKVELDFVNNDVNHISVKVIDLRIEKVKKIYEDKLKENERAIEEEMKNE
nr:hypothetical protein [Sediminibacterium sp.]